MSALAGIYNFNGTPVDPEVVTAMGTALEHLGPDGGDERCDHSVGMAYRAFHTTYESRSESQPVVSDQGAILTWDGRIDNRPELINLLRGDLRADRTDAGLVSLGLQKYGADFLPKIIGNFALAWWNPRTRTLLLARDPFGTRSLFYHSDKNRILWASEIRPLIETTTSKVEIDDEYISGYLILFPEPGRTPYKRFHAVEPGHVVISHDGHLKSYRFWGPDPSKEIRYWNDTEYEEHLRHLLFEGVSCCLRGDDRPIWSCLSGGLDSSSIVCIADQLIESGEVSVPRLDTFSIVYDQATTADERRFIRIVEEKRGRTGYHLHDDDLWLRFPPPEQSILYMPSPLHCIPMRSDQLRREMGRNDARVLLNGNGGDQLFWNMLDASPELTDMVAQGELLQLHRRVQIWSGVFNTPYMQLLWKQAVLPFLPLGIRARYQPGIKIAGWFDGHFVTRTHLRERLIPPPDPFGFDKPGRRILSSVYLQAVWLIASGLYQEKRGVETRYPFLHRPLVEFLLAIPFDQKLRVGETRSLMRRALRNVLPEKILRRKGKGIIGEVINRGLSRERQKIESLLNDSRVCAYGYANAAALKSAFKLALHGGQVDIVGLLNTLSLEIWLRSIESSCGVLKSTSDSDEKATTRSMVERLAGFTAF